jgi:hypothetical protein
LKRFMIDSTDSTSSMGIGVPGLKSSRPRSVQALTDWSLTSAAYSLKTLKLPRADRLLQLVDGLRG